MRRDLRLIGAEAAPDRQIMVDRPAFWKRPLPEFVGDLSGVHTPHSLFVQDRIRHGKYQTRLDNVSVFGSHHFHAFLGADATLSLQETDQDRIEARVDYHIANHPGAETRIPLIARSAPHQYVCSTAHLGPDDVQHIPGPVFFGSPTEPDNWGMWLLNGLSSAQFYRAQGKGAQYLCWIRFEWQRKLLQFMEIPDEAIIVQEPWRIYDCSSVHLEQYSKVDLIPTDSDRAVLAEIRARSGAPRAALPEKIFVSRRRVTAGGSYRALVNEDALIAALEAEGFVTVEPETMRFEDQVRLFAAARVVVGLGGAAMFNTVFCAEGTRVVTIEGSTAFVDNHAGLFAGLGLRYAILLGRQDPTDPMEVHKRWTIDVAQAVRHITEFV
jgi:capsular polysaccharide biosynthesis protein